MIGTIVRTGLGAGLLLALVDLAQVAGFAPGSLSVRNAAILVGLYVGSAAAVATVLCPAVGFVRRGPAGPLVAALVLAGGVFVLVQEIVLRTLPPLSSWRMLAVAGVAVGGVVLAAALVRLFDGMRLPLWAAVLGGGALVTAGMGAVRGFDGLDQARDQPPPASSTKPNVLLVLIDTLRADHLGAYGYERPTSPRLDGFANEGALFLHAYSQSSWTKPATASLHTSHFPSQHQTFLEKQRLPESELLLSEVLREAGWATAVLSGNPWVTPEWGFSQGVDHFFSIYDERFARVTLYMMALKRFSKLMGDGAFLYNRVKKLVQGELSTTARDERINVEAFRWLAEPRDRPFFLYLHYMSPHHPYDPPPPFDRFVPDESIGPVTYYPKKSYYFFEEGEQLPDPERADMIARYDGDILFVDTVFGKLIDHLRAARLLENTIVLVVADHGEEFFDHRNWGHGQSIYDELIRVPLLMRFPARVPAALRVEQPVMSVDVMPTILDLLGVARPAHLAGRSLVPILDGTPAGVPPEAYSELLYRYGEAHGLVQGRTKVIEMNKGEERRTELFDLAVDPREQTDLMATSPRGSALVARMTAIRTDASAHRATADENVPMSDEMSKRLKALGYLN